MKTDDAASLIISDYRPSAIRIDTSRVELLIKDHATAVHLQRDCVIASRVYDFVSKQVIVNDFHDFLIMHYSFDRIGPFPFVAIKVLRFLSRIHTL